MKPLFRFGHLLIIISLLNSCGYIDILEQKMQSSFLNLPNVVKATSVDISKGLVVPGSYIVVFKNRGAPHQYSSFYKEYQSQYLRYGEFAADPNIKDLSFITSINLQVPEKTYTQATFNSPKTLQLFWEDKDQDLDRFMGTMFQVDFVSPQAAIETLSKWDEDGLIWFADPNYQSSVSQSPAGCSSVDSSNYQDCYGNESSGVLSNWWHIQIKLEAGLAALSAAGKFNNEVQPVIAVMDSGVDYQHEALRDKIWVNDAVNASSCLEDIHGCNTVRGAKGYLGTGEVWPYGMGGPSQSCTSTGDPDFNVNTCRHGTHVAGLIAGAPSGSVGGVCPMCQIMVLRVVSDDTGEIPDNAMLNAFKYVSLFQKQGQGVVRVVNSSFGKFQRSRAIGLIVRLLYEYNSGTLVIAAAGNEDTAKRSYPAAFEDALAVAATDQAGRRSYFSNYGPWVDISGPGGGNTGLTSTAPGGEFADQGGTSQATPMVAGVAGLVLAMQPDISASDLRSRLMRTADGFKLYDDSPDNFNQAYYPSIYGEGKRPLLGSGLVDAEAAIKNGNTSTAKNTLADFDRVGDGCGSISELRGAGANNLFLVLLGLFMMPIATGVIRSVRRD